MAWPTISLNNKPQAISYFQAALTIAKKLYGANNHFVARYHYMLGQAYEINGQNEKAQHEYNQALNIANRALASIKHPSIQKGYQDNIEKIKELIAK